MDWHGSSYERRTCDNCGNYYVPRSYYQKFCCRQCCLKASQYEAAMKRAEKHPPIVKACKKCKKDFKTGDYRQKYCSDMCKAEDKIVEANANWTNKTIKNRKRQNLRMQMFYELGNKPSDSALKKCNACRG